MGSLSIYGQTFVDSCHGSLVDCSLVMFLHGSPQSGHLHIEVLVFVLGHVDYGHQSLGCLISIVGASWRWCELAAQSALLASVPHVLISGLVNVRRNLPHTGSHNNTHSNTLNNTHVTVGVLFTRSNTHNNHHTNSNNNNRQTNKQTTDSNKQPQQS